MHLSNKASIKLSTPESIAPVEVNIRLDEDAPVLRFEEAPPQLSDIADYQAFQRPAVLTESLQAADGAAVSVLDIEDLADYPGSGHFEYEDLDPNTDITDQDGDVSTVPS